MTPEAFISSQPADRQPLLKDLHAIILAEDKTVIPVVEPMMGVEMIIYKDRGMMKYGLASVKKYMSLHLLPIYANPTLHGRYKALLDKASFQKGCINFTDAQEMPPNIVRNLIADCSGIDLKKIREDYLQSKKIKKGSPK